MGEVCHLPRSSVAPQEGRATETKKARLSEPLKLGSCPSRAGKDFGCNQCCLIHPKNGDDLSAPLIT